MLRALGHTVVVEQRWSGDASDLMIALHARRSHDSIRRFRAAHPQRPLVVALTGTDLYRDIESNPDAQASLEMATRLVVLQELGAKALPRTLRRKVSVVYQSAPAVTAPKALVSCFEVVVSGHLREEKDPFRAAAALALLPTASRIRVTHIGGALSREMEAQARGWMRREPRYRWLGELPRARALRVLARGRAMVISSRMEGGANVVSEALVAGVPVLASRIAGNVGMLGARYPAYFPVGDERALARLLARFESDAVYRERLRRACAARAARVTPARESAALARLLAQCMPKARKAGARPLVKRPARAK